MATPLSPTPYDDVLATTFQPPTSIIAQPWNCAQDVIFGGDIKINERKIDMKELPQESDLPEYLRNKYISVYVRNFDVIEDSWNDLNMITIINGDLTEFRTQEKLFTNMWAQAEAVIERLLKQDIKLFEIRATFYCYQSNLESLILKQILCQEFSDAPDILIVTDPKYCYVRFFKRAMEPNLKKFSKRIRSAFELTELASRTHAVALKYNAGPFPDFQCHEVAPMGFKPNKDDE